MAPLYAWAAAAGTRGRVTLPWSVAFIFRFLIQELEGEGRMAKVRCQVKDLGVIFKADAKAAGQHVKLGGWECRGGLPPSRARWFAVELTKQTAPWAYSRGEPFRSTAALELFASMWAWPRKVGTRSFGTRELVRACIPHASNTAADRSSAFA